LPAHFIVILEDYSEEWKSPKPPRELPSGEDCKCNAIEFIYYKEPLREDSMSLYCYIYTYAIHLWLGINSELWIFF
jgi:hypothetical protein